MTQQLKMKKLKVKQKDINKINNEILDMIKDSGRLLKDDTIDISDYQKTNLFEEE